MQFRLLGFPVRVDVSFWIVAAMLGATRSDLSLLLVWVAVVFVSVLIHELGHATLARVYGHEPSITLYSMGGLTAWRPRPDFGPLRQVTVSLAGPMAGFAFGGAVFGIAPALPPDAPFAIQVAVRDLLWVNFGWGLLNLLPVLPLDGGHALRSLFHAARGRADDRLPLKISIVVGGAAAVGALLYGMFFAAMLAGTFTYENFRSLRRIGAGTRSPADPT